MKLVFRKETIRTQKRLSTAFDQLACSDDSHVVDAVLVQDLHLEIGQVDGEAELDFRDALLHHFVGICSAHVWLAVPVHDADAEEAAVAVDGVRRLDHRRQVVHPVELRPGSLAVAGQ